MSAARKHAAERAPEFQPVWEPAEVIAKRVAGGKRSAIQGLLDSSIDADDLATARLCRTALQATDPWRSARERLLPLSAVQREAIRKCERLARKHCGNCGAPGAFLCSVCAEVCGLPHEVER